MDTKDRNLVFLMVTILFALLFIVSAMIKIEKQDVYIKELEEYKTKSDSTISSLSHSLDRIDSMARSLIIYDLLYK